MPPPRYRIEIADRQKCMAVDRQVVRAVVRTVLDSEGVPAAALSIAVVDDATIAEVHGRFLGQHQPTDVITFPFHDPGQGPVEAEIVISAETACREARRRRLSPLRELALYLVHGLLHLCGYDDHDEQERKRMRSRERHYLRQLAPLLARDATR